jgi:DNA-binding protein HU-beta
MAKMTKNQLIDAIAEGTQVSKADVKAVIEQMATVGYKELNESGEFVIQDVGREQACDGSP